MITDKTFIKSALTTASPAVGLPVPPSEKALGGFFPIDPDGLIVITGNEEVPLQESLGAALAELKDLQPSRMSVVIQRGAKDLPEVEQLQAFILERCHPATRCNILFEFTRRNAPSASIFISRREQKGPQEKVVRRHRTTTGTGFLDIFWTRVEKKALEVYESRNAHV